MEAILNSVRDCRKYLNSTDGNGWKISLNLVIATICLGVDWAFMLDLATIIMRNEYGIVPAEREVERYLLACIGMIAIIAVHFGFQHLYKDFQILVQILIAVLAVIFIINMSKIQNARYVRLISERILPSETPPDVLSYLVNTEVATEENRRIAEGRGKIESAYIDMGLNREGLIKRLSWFSLAFVICSFVSLFCFENFMHLWAIGEKCGVAKHYLKQFTGWQNTKAEIEQAQVIKTTLSDKRFQRSCVKTIQTHIVQLYIHGLRFLGMLLNNYLIFFIKSQCINSQKT